MLKQWLITAMGTALRPIFPQKPIPRHPKSLVVLKPCCLGDVVLATPALAALAHRFPDAAIDVAVGRWSRAVLVNNPRVRALIDCGRVGQGAYGWGDVRALAKTLRRQNYDVAVTLDRSPLVGLVPWLAGIPHRVGMDSAGRGFAHTARVSVPATPRHEAQLYLDVALAGTAAETDFWTEFYPPKDDAALPELPPTPFVILHPAGGVNPGMRMPDKRWLPQRFAALADRFSAAGWRVVFSGTAVDVSLCAQITAQMTAPADILAGKLSLGQFGALCRRAALFVGGDTGAMHVAVASGCKTVAIFGPTDPRRYGPFAPEGQATVIWKARHLPVGGVGQGHISNFSWGDSASVDEVAAACAALLGVSSI